MSDGSRSRRATIPNTNARERPTAMVAMRTGSCSTGDPRQRVGLSDARTATGP